ncbi:MAG: YceI family protein [Rhodanobacteraceae bacterium]|nr:YceI family protein [Rhodanobacteraceae bacterium]
MRLPLLTLLCLLSAAPAAAAIDAWRIDPVHTQILFSIDHQGFNQALGLIRASEGRLHLDPEDWSTARLEVTIDMNSLLLGDAKWEEAVRSWRFLDTRRWPQARFRSLRVERSSDGRGSAHGELELHGHTRPLSIEFRLNKLANDPYAFKRTAGFSATARLKRSEFGMDKVLSAVGDTVELRIEAAFVRDRDADATSDASTTGETDAIQE